MSAQPTQNTAPNLVNIEVDGKPIQVPKGSMIIEATDKAGIPIPRFCYHRKLPIAASCRQCLVEVEMGGRPMPKPQPACATPVAEGMKVLTRSDKALHAQRNVMEFLLINHPMDCPICDQGGECELQDMALGYGRSVSRFTERKRTIADEDIGPLVATEMTRCIHCTRCVRFISEIAGTYEFGSMDRGDRHVIGTYIGKNVESELSGNIIDVCPVGALTNKPFQFKARAWELIAKPSIAWHDALGSNLWLHTRRGEVLRTVPRDNEAVNECWLSDRDRYSHQGMYAADRISAPEVKRNGQWQATTWEDALQFAGEALKKAPGSELGILLHPATSNEEGDLLMRLARGLGSAHVDHRLRQLDFADNAVAQPFTLPVAEVEQVRAALLVGSDLRYEMPLLNHRLHQATKKGARVYAVNPAHFDFNYKLAGEAVVAPQAMVDALLALAKAAVAAGANAPAALAEAIASAQSDQGDSDAIAALKSGKAVVIVGEAAVTHPQASWLRAITRFIADATGAGYDELPVGANAVGLAQLGVVPGNGGLDAQAMLAQPRKSYLLYGVEPPHDFADGGAALRALHGADQVVAFSAYAGAALREVADVILPIALLPEIDATLVNVDGLAQGVAAGAKAPGEARPGWKVLRALGGAMQLAGFEFDDIAGLREGISARAQVPRQGLSTRAAPAALTRLATWPIYRLDAVLRRATALNAHPLNRAPAIRLNEAEARRQGLVAGAQATIGEVQLPVLIDAAVPDGAVWIEAAHDLTATLPPHGAAITLSKA
ncbi:NADH-quinone oxidoreductase subunit G [Rhodanobacter thiooxydans]|uniref:NADH-quinone oxidoreductase n=1 Tax=Rhodanobacter thiooxydans TaxID=416169 RepID=A0A154QHQ5_9GAMM|nr:NADH-quinone oxidoreductase subunit NuoG [Rhodanobacter thiooxydans]EIL99947.1 NADH dehydrogenase subunit G [Rhodanobacter thiooxydans LCS2]KZC23528.1 NADH-quinone oxidoreductase subunit G [Rhodanobacter thiooxydans]MCW0200570.1 NADH-quinone oxidoreductase subunit NuoG [Rhodanobacter thiooxydans]